MGKGIEIDIAANARDFQRGTKDVETALEGVADALDEVTKDAARAGDKIGDEISDGARDGSQKAGRDLDGIGKDLKSVEKDASKAGRELGDEISDGAKDAAKSTEKLERSFKDVADASKRETRTAGDSMQQNIKQGTDGASDAVREFGDEATQNMAETFSSFRGETEDFVQIAQDTFGGVIANLGPLGMAAGAAGALGIGLLMGSMEKAKEEEEEFRAQVGELAAELIELGDDPAAAAEKIAEKLRELASETEEGKASLADLHQAAKYTATGYQDLADAATGYGENLDDIVKAEKKRLDAAEDAYNQDKRWDSEKTAQLKAQRDNLRTAVSGLQELQEATKEAAKEEAALAASNHDYYKSRAEALESIQGELDNTIDSWGEYVNAETGAIDPGAYIKGMAAKREAITNFTSNVQQMTEEFGLSYEEQQAILDQGLDFAPHIQSIIDSGMAEAYVNEFRLSHDGAAAIFNGTPLIADVKAEAKTDDARALLSATKDEERTAIIGTKADTRAADRGLNQTATKKRTATVTARADTSTASKQLSNLARKRTSTVTVKLDLTQANRDLTEFVNRARTTYVDVVTRTGKKKP